MASPHVAPRKKKVSSKGMLLESLSDSLNGILAGSLFSYITKIFGPQFPEL